MIRHDISAVVERLAGRRIKASVSGGKDSGAMSLYLRELGLDHDRNFNDTGWESYHVYHYVLPREQAHDAIEKLEAARASLGLGWWTSDEIHLWLDGQDKQHGGDAPLQRALGPINRVKPPLSMVDLIFKKGMFPSKRRRFCTEETKVFPMQAYLAGLADRGMEIVNAIGIRHAESEERSRMPEWEWSEGFDCEVWRPMISWTDQDVIDIHSRHGLRPNPLYLMGMSRVGCWPCIYARKFEIKLISDLDPRRVELLRALEIEVARRAGERYAARGETFESLGYMRPTWFQAPVGRRRARCPECNGSTRSGEEACPGCEGKGEIRLTAGECWPIDRVVEWSRTARGGRQFELFAAQPGEAGCMRWGLCETARADEDERGEEHSPGGSCGL